MLFTRFSIAFFSIYVNVYKLPFLLYALTLTSRTLDERTITTPGAPNPASIPTVPISRLDLDTSITTPVSHQCLMGELDSLPRPL